MRSMKYELTVLKTRRDLLSLNDVADRVGIHPETLRRFIDAGLLEPAETIGTAILFDAKAVHRLRVIQRLRCDLGINLSGVAVILELLDRINTLQRGGRYGHQ